MERKGREVPRGWGKRVSQTGLAPWAPLSEPRPGPRGLPQYKQLQTRDRELIAQVTHTCLDHRHHCPAAMSYPVTSQPQCASSCYQTQLSDWHTGLTDCCNDMPVCLCGTFAPLCLACRISDDFGECCCAPYLPGGLHSLRTGMRERYRIQVRAAGAAQGAGAGLLGPPGGAPNLSLPPSRVLSGTTGRPSPFACPAPSVRWRGN
uniref:Cornifelin n=1 Tax=Suricata suricatta TaxID=37032 RepID=A0A673VR67_SURSU